MPMGSMPSRAPEPTGAGAPTNDAAAAEVGVWLGHFSRTLKTCRLYDAKNPTTIKFREDLGTRFLALVQAHGPVTLEFSSSEVSFGGQAVLTSKSRDDNFAMPFYRDGLRSLTFQPGAGTAALDTVIDLLLRVTNRSTDSSEDLVTLLWDADLECVDMKYVAAETDVDLGDGGEPEAALTAERSAEPMPWPGGSAGMASEAGPPDSAGWATTVTGITLELISREGDSPLRSEDWLVGDPAHELEPCYRELQPSLATETARFTQELLQERQARLVDRVLALVRSVLAAELREEDRTDLTTLLRRLLMERIGDANWKEASDTLACLVEVTKGAWDSSLLVTELAQADSPATAAVVRHLDASTVAELGEFTSFARTLGVPAADWLMSIIAVAEQERTRKSLMRPVTDLCEGRPERLSPWLSDERWHVVRNAVIVVGSTEGGAPPDLIRPLVGHPEARVRQEVVAALTHMPPDSARPMLLELIRDAEPAVRSAALYELGTKRHAEVAAALLRIVLQPGFRKRPVDEVRSVTAALGGCGGDEVLPDLEGQLSAPQWFAGTADGPYCQAIARCIARIGTPAALAILERGAESKAPITRETCRLVLKGMHRG